MGPGESNIAILSLMFADCNVYTEVNFVALFIGLVSAMVIVAVILLIVWKVVTTIMDDRELQRFNQEKENAQWETVCISIARQFYAKYTCISLFYN